MSNNRMVKIILIVAHPKTGFCGVTDYTTKLAEALTISRYDTHVENIGAWSIGSVWKLRQKYRKARQSVLFHVQYPSTGIGKSLAPAIIGPLLGFAPIYITLHEFSVFNVFRKLLFLPYLIYAKKIIFSNEWEKKVFAGFFPLRSRLTVIPIGSNIPIFADHIPRDLEKPRIIYFGQIVENKGIENICKAIALLRRRALNFDAAFIGSPVKPDSDIVRELRDFSRKEQVEMLFNLGETEVSQELSRSDIAILPFPDGVSEKRGSALAALEHGVKIVTVHSEKTPNWLKAGTLHAKEPAEIADAVQNIIEKRILVDEPPELARIKWPHIVNEHGKLYGLPDTD